MPTEQLALLVDFAKHAMTCLTLIYGVICLGQVIQHWLHSAQDSAPNNTPPAAETTGKNLNLQLVLFATAIIISIASLFIGFWFVT